MATNSLFPMPKPFNFSHAKEWVWWSKRFERYREVTGLSDKAKLSKLVYLMGEQADDIFTFLALMEEETIRYLTVKEKFVSHYNYQET